MARMHPGDVTYVGRKLRRAMVTGEKYTGTVRALCPDGVRYRVLRFSGWLTVVDGAIERIRGEVRVLGPCEHDRTLATPWHFGEAVECLALAFSLAAFA